MLRFFFALPVPQHLHKAQHIRCYRDASSRANVRGIQLTIVLSRYSLGGDALPRDCGEHGFWTIKQHNKTYASVRVFPIGNSISLGLRRPHSRDFLRSLARSLTPYSINVLAPGLRPVARPPSRPLPRRL